MSGGLNFVNFDPLLEDLRDGIREELRLEEVSGPVWWLRLGKGQPAPGDSPPP